jgi:hypothetical protein
MENIKQNIEHHVKLVLFNQNTCRNMKKNLSILASALLFASIVLVSSCKKEEHSHSNVMVVHASPDAPGVDLLVDDSKQNSAALGFPSNTGYLEVESGTRNIKVNVSGTTTTVIEADLMFTKDMSYSIFAVDSVSTISPLVLTDDLTAPAAGKAHVRFVHLSPDAPAVDVAVASSGAVVFGNKAFKEYTAFTPLDAGNYNLDVRVAGTTTVALVLPTITLEAGKIYTVFAKGFLGGTGAQALGAEIIVNK